MAVGQKKKKTCTIVKGERFSAFTNQLFSLRSRPLGSQQVALQACTIHYCVSGEFLNVLSSSVENMLDLHTPQVGNELEEAESIHERTYL